MITEYDFNSPIPVYQVGEFNTTRRRERRVDEVKLLKRAISRYNESGKMPFVWRLGHGGTISVRKSTYGYSAYTEAAVVFVSRSGVSLWVNPDVSSFSSSDESIAYACCVYAGDLYRRKNSEKISEAELRTRQRAIQDCRVAHRQLVKQEMAATFVGCLNGDCYSILDPYMVKVFDKF